ncbi:MAG: HAD family phosphatase [Planctomycetes bacterium]|nr:HAD family phosphatase [Planctomycetota bacterium]
MLEAVIFDFDGVITDSEILHFRTFNQVLASYGIKITKNDYYKNYLGLTDRDVFGLMAEKLGSTAPPIEKLIEQKNHIFEELAKTDGKIIEGVRNFLQMLYENKIPMAICSGALLVEIEIVLEGAKLRHFFEAVVSAEQVKKGKPNPQGYLLALAKLNAKKQTSIKPNQCIGVEDSHWGLEAIKAARMHPVAITNSYNAEQLKPAEKIVANLNELSIEDLNKICN